LGKNTKEPEVEHFSAQVHFSFMAKHRSIVTEAVVRSIFSDFGDVKDVLFTKFSVGSTGKPYGTGFVQFSLTHDGIVSAMNSCRSVKQLVVNNVIYHSHSYELKNYLSSSSRLLSSQIPRFAVPQLINDSAKTKISSPAVKLSNSQSWFCAPQQQTQHNNVPTNPSTDLRLVHRLFYSLF
jgi:hypothetical protein